MDIKSVIRKYGFTVNSLATKHGVGQSRLNQMVNGNPSAKNLEWLASLIGCSPAEFFADWVSPTAETQQPASQPAEGQQGQGSAADELPFTGGGDGGKRQEAERTGGGQPTATVQQAIICPHCKRAIAITVNGI